MEEKRWPPGQHTRNSESTVFLFKLYFMFSISDTFYGSKFKSHKIIYRDNFPSHPVPLPGGNFC